MAFCSKLLKTCLVSVTILCCFVFMVSAVNGEATSEEAVVAIAQAEETLTVAYRSVLEAERAGANVSGLLVKLNSAADLLENASIFYRKGDFTGAVQNATVSSQMSEQVKVDAPYLQKLAVADVSWRVGWTGFGSAVGAFAIGGCSFLGWRVFRKRYLRKMLKLKPEVVVDES